MVYMGILYRRGYPEPKYSPDGALEVFLHLPQNFPDLVSVWGRRRSHCLLAIVHAGVKVQLQITRQPEQRMRSVKTNIMTS